MKKINMSCTITGHKTLTFFLRIIYYKYRGLGTEHREIKVHVLSIKRVE